MRHGVPPHHRVDRSAIAEPLHHHNAVIPPTRERCNPLRSPIRPRHPRPHRSALLSPHQRLPAIRLLWQRTRRRGSFPHTPVIETVVIRLIPSILRQRPAAPSPAENPTLRRHHRHALRGSDLRPAGRAATRPPSHPRVLLATSHIRLFAIAGNYWCGLGECHCQKSCL